MVRELAFGSTQDDAFVIALFQRFGVPPEAIHELMDVVRAGGTMTQAGMSQHHRAVVQDLYAVTWFVTPYTDGSRIALSQAGSRPGESWADIVFAFVYHKVLEEIQRAAVNEGFAIQLDFSGKRTPFVDGERLGQVRGPVHATWADDTAFFTGDVSAEVALSNARLLASHVLRSCRKYGMQPNLKKGKSAIILALRGRHSRAVRKAQFPRVVNTLDIDTGDDHGSAVHLEVQYTDLGTVLHRDGSMFPEAKLRLGVAAAAYKKYGKILLSNPSISLPVRRQFFVSLVGGVFFNLALWTSACRGWDHIMRGYSLLQRRLLQPFYRHDDLLHVRGRDVSALVDLPSLDILCRMRRLVFLTTVVTIGDDALWALLHAEKEWASQLCDDLRWLWTTVRLPLPFPRHSSWADWEQYIVHHTNGFKEHVRRAGYAAHSQERLEQLSLRAVRVLSSLRATAGGEASTRSESLNAFWCGPCMRSFRNKAALATHFFQMHGRVARFRHLAFGSSCNACGKIFRGEHQLALHLRACKVCCDSLSAKGFWQHDVLPGIGSSVWKRLASQDLGLVLPTAPTHDVTTQGSDELVWDENADLVAAFLGGTELVLDSAGDEADTAFDFAMFLSGFPLFPEEITFVTNHMIEVAATFGIQLGEVMREGVRTFFKGELVRDQVDHGDDRLLEDGFWQWPMGPRPSFEGPWLEVRQVQDGLRIAPAAAGRIALIEGWHQGDWPPGSLRSSSFADQPASLRCLCTVLAALTVTNGWLWAPDDFWDSVIAIPFRMFHCAGN